MGDRPPVQRFFCELPPTPNTKHLPPPILGYSLVSLYLIKHSCSFTLNMQYIKDSVLNDTQNLRKYVGEISLRGKIWHKLWTFLNRPYWKLAADLIFFCMHINWPLWPRFRVKILLNFLHDNEVIRANLYTYKRILSSHFSIRSIKKKDKNRRPIAETVT